MTRYSCRRAPLALGLISVAAIVVIAGRATSQTPGGIVASGDRVARPASPTRHDETPPLLRVVSLSLRRVTLREALGELDRQGRLGLTYLPREVPLDRLVSISAPAIATGDALSELLAGTGLEAATTQTGRVMLVRQRSAPTAAMQGSGSIVGRVTDAATYIPLDQVAVRVEGLGVGGVTAADGRYLVHNILPGMYHITARRVGYTPLTQTVTITADSAATANFALAAAATKLNEVVTTAVGDQRRYEVGNTISTINADSIAPTTPITSLTDLISARAPGVAVEEAGGLTGSGEAIRVRGQSSLVLQGDPILIVDGVRQDNTPGGSASPIGFNGGFVGADLSPSRLNDLDFNDIETIDVLKGPAASTEYGTDAANGVIVITTKRGIAGRPQWRASAEETESGMPVTFPTLYHSWGHTTDATQTPVVCPLVPFAYGSGYGSSTGSCAVDSVTAWNPLNHPYYSIFGTGNRQKYNLSVGGGSEAVQYYVAGSVTNERGLLQMPGVFIADATALGLPRSTFHPNGEEQRSVRATSVIRLGPAADVTVTGAYLSTYHTSPAGGELNLIRDVGIGVGAVPEAAANYGYGPVFGSPLYNLGFPASQTTNRVTGAMATTWRPVLWFVGHGTAGIDYGSQAINQDALPQVQLLYPPSAGGLPGSQLVLGNATMAVYTVDLRGSATAALGRVFRAVTSVGLQLADTRLQGVTAFATGVTTSNLTLNGAANPMTTQLGNRQATLGGYAEEELGVSDRVFLTGALRVDAGSGFGRSYSTATYPKASLSWLAANGGPTTLRLRAAFGESGVQPPNGAALQLYAPAAAYSGGTLVTGTIIANVQNQTLQPERSAEVEGGVDFGLWQTRVSVELTGYSKTTHNALVSTGAGWDLGGYPHEENVGEVRNTGVEGTLTGTVLRARALTWDVTVNASLNHNTLLSLAPGIPAQQFQGFFGTTYRFAPGYPLYGYWAPAVQYSDLNHDGVIEPDEVTLADSLGYVGSDVPTREASVGTHVSLWRGALTVGALVDYRGGFRLLNGSAASQADFAQSDRASNDRSAPAWQQARDVAAEKIYAQALDSFAFPAGFYEDATYVRFREASLTYAVPHAVVHALRVQQLSLTGAVRNLALWTRYTGPDPEVTSSAGQNTQLNATSNTYTVNNNMRADVGAIPLLRYWVVRLNIGL